VFHSLYDDGNLLSLVDNTGTTSFTYDVLNRIKTKTLPDGVVFTTGYDKNGNLTSFDDGGGTVSYQYDAANRMTTLTDTNSSQTIYTYDKANRKTMIQYPNGTGMKMTYDKAGHELTSIGGAMDINGTFTTTYSSFTYNYKAGSTQTALLQSVTLLDPTNWQSGTTLTRQYSYNKLNRLTDAAVFNSNNVKVEDYSYTYDAAGNRLTSSVLSTGVSDSYTYNAANELTTRTEGSTTTTYSYDGNGNLTGSTGGPLLSYNSKNQTKNIGSDTYTYSGPDQRDRVTVNTTTFDYSGLGLSRQTDSTGTTHYVRCSCGLLNNERTPDGHRHYFLFDGLGSIVGVTKGDGTKENSYDYDPYGNMLHQTEGVTNPWKFAGGFLDSSTGLYKFGTRYDDPTLGRWTQQDPVGGSLGDLNAANRYTYAGDDPVNLVDPSGKDALSCILFPFALALAFLSFPALGFGVGVVFVLTGGIAGVFALFVAIVAIGFELITLIQLYHGCYG